VDSLTNLASLLASRRVIYPALLLVLFLGVWELASDRGWLPVFLVPAPSTIFRRTIETRDLLATHALATSYEILVGFLLAVAGGVLLGVAVVSSRTVEDAVYPWLVVVQVIPKVAVGPLLAVWLGFGFGPKILIAFLLAFFPIMINTMLGFKSIQREATFLMQTMGARRSQVFRYLLLPHALPSICGSLKIAITLATVGAIVGEFIGSNTGLGYVLMTANGILDAGLLFVALFWITVVAMIFYAAVSLVERLLIPWHVSMRPPAAVR
jgi:NitT/TauT family transport system permease protein